MVVRPTGSGSLVRKVGNQAVSSVQIMIDSKWVRRSQGGIKLKRVTSIAQTQRDATHPNAPIFNGPGNGPFQDAAKLIGNAWQNVMLGGRDWDSTVTVNQGSYPGRPYVTWSADNDWFNERDIVVQTRIN